LAAALVNGLASPFGTGNNSGQVPVSHGPIANGLSGLPGNNHSQVPGTQSSIIVSPSGSSGTSSTVDPASFVHVHTHPAAVDAVFQLGLDDVIEG
jgi:hypothetical protein